MRTMLVWAALCVVALASRAAGAARQETCLPQARAAGPQCEPSVEVMHLERRRPHQLRTSTVAPRKKAEPAATSEPSATIVPHKVRHLRHLDRKLLLAEISSVSRLLRATPKQHADRPRLLVRLADSYAELESSTAREQVALEERARQLGDSDRLRSRALATKATGLQAVVERARKSAIRYYRHLVRAYPRYCQAPRAKRVEDRGCPDEILYFLGYELEQDGRPGDAHDAYAELIKSWPRSPYVSLGWLARAELLYRQAPTDAQRWSQAASMYQASLARAPVSSETWTYAQYKLGHVRWNQGKLGDALELLKKTVEQALRHHDNKRDQLLLEAAKRDLVALYARAGDARRAWSFFEALLGDAPGAARATVEMMRALAEALKDTGQHAAVIATLEQLLRHDDDGSSSCRYRADIARSTIASEPDRKDLAMTALRALRKARIELLATDKGSDAARACTQVSAERFTDTAMAWHIEAVGSAGTRGTGASGTMDSAAELYGWVVTDFDDGGLRARVLYAHGDLEHGRGRWLACGQLFDAAVTEAPDASSVGDALIGSAECWFQAFETARASRKHDGAHAHEMLEAFDRYLCRIARADAIGSPERTAIELARANVVGQVARCDAGEAPARSMGGSVPLGTKAPHDADREKRL